MQGTYSFFNEPYDLQLVLGITLIGIPDTWDSEHLLRYLRTYGFLFGESPTLGFCGVSLQEATADLPRRAHLLCDSLVTKQRCLRMRVIPVVMAHGDEPGPHQCTVISIRPYAFWVKMTKDSPVLPYMFPKYTSREVVGEEFEAKMLLMPNNQRTLVVATLIGSGIIPTDHRHLDVSSALQLWLSEISGSGGQQLTEQLSHLHRAVSNFVPAPLGATDELIVAADHRHLFTWTWQWDARAHRLLDHCQSPRLPHDLGSYGFGGECVLGAKIKRGSRHTGCIRYENNRKRWVVDLSVNGCRMQKCFHENLYGFVGGLQEARRWRLDYIRSAHNEFDIETEERIVNDLVDKIIAMDSSLHAELLDALREPVPGYEHILDARSLRSIVDGRLAALGFLQP